MNTRVSKTGIAGLFGVTTLAVWNWVDSANNQPREYRGISKIRQVLDSLQPCGCGNRLELSPASS
jgi:hypothetical protein